jgi:hypothetical protein
MVDEAVQDLFPQAQHGVQGVHRALWNVGHARKPHPSHGVAREGQQIFAVQQCLATGDPTGRVDHLHQGQRRRRLARPAFTHQGHTLADGHVEGDATHGVDDARRGEVVDGQVADGEKGHPRRLNLGFASSSRPAFSR